MNTSKPAGRQRWLPHPVMSLTLVAAWMLLQNAFSFAHFVLALALGLIIPLATASFWPQRPRIRSYRKALAYVLLVLWDIAVANIQVARLILLRAPGSLRTRWVCLPLALRSPEAISLLAGTITMTPGTVSCDLAADGRSLLVHCLDVPDAAAAVADMKARYEARIQEMLE